MKADNDQVRESESFNLTIEALKTVAAKANVTITDHDLIAVLRIPIAVFEGYVRADSAPVEIFSKLRSSYGRFMQATYTSIVVEGELDVPSDVVDFNDDVEG